MSVKRMIAGMLSASAILMAAASNATTLEKLSFGEIVKEASACIIGDVLSVVTEKRGNEVVTLTTFKVTKTAFGQVPETITVMTSGGSTQLGRLSVSEVVAGTPRFFNDQNSLMLLSEDKATGTFQIVGTNQGLFAVNGGPSGNSTVFLPEGLGGEVTVEDALQIIQQQRITPTENGLGQ